MGETFHNNRRDWIKGETFLDEIGEGKTLLDESGTFLHSVFRKPGHSPLILTQNTKTIPPTLKSPDSLIHITPTYILCQISDD